MIGVCPGCGKPFRIEKAKGDEGWVYCEDVCINPADMPTGERLMADQATKLYVDGNMNEMKREVYIKTHGFRSGACDAGGQQMARGADHEMGGLGRKKRRGSKRVDQKTDRKEVLNLSLAGDRGRCINPRAFFIRISIAVWFRCSIHYSGAGEQ